MTAAAAFAAVTTLLAKALGQGVGGEPLHPLQITAGRYCFGFLTLLPFLLWYRPSLRGAVWRTHVLRTICGWGGVTCLFTASVFMVLADATAISFLSPLVTMVLAIPILGERVGPWRWGAAGFAVIGALLVIRPGSDAFQAAALIALGAALLMGMETIFIKRLSDTEPPIRILAINNAVGSLIAVAAAAFVWAAPSPRQWLMMAAVGTAMVTAQSLFIQAMKRADASFVIPFFYATLVFAALYDFAVFGDMPTIVSAAGAVVIIASAVVLAWRENRRR